MLVLASDKTERALPPRAGYETTTARETDPLVQILKGVIHDHVDRYRSDRLYQRVVQLSHQARPLPDGDTRITDRLGKQDMIIKELQERIANLEAIVIEEEKRRPFKEL